MRSSAPSLRSTWALETSTHASVHKHARPGRKPTQLRAQEHHCVRNILRHSRPTERNHCQIARNVLLTEGKAVYANHARHNHVDANASRGQFADVVTSKGALCAFENRIG